MITSTGRMGRWFGVLLSATAVFVAACGGGSSSGTSTASSQPSATVKIGCNREISEAFLWNIAQYAKKYNITPDCVEMESYVASMQAVTKGDVDIGILGYPQIATLADNAVSNVKVVVGYGVAGQNIIARKSLNVTSWSDLKGKSVCAPLPTGAGIMLQVAMIENNIQPSSTKLTQTGFTGTAELQSLQAGQCDTLTFWSPVVDTAVVDGYGKYLTPGLDLNKTSVGPGNGVMLAGQKLLGNHTLLVNFLKAFTESLTFMKGHQDQWQSVATQLTGTRSEVVKEALKHQTLDYDIDVNAAKAVAKYGSQFGFSKADQTGKVSSYVDASFLAQAVGKSQGEVTKKLTYAG
jgi:ABC-type nitrate/sulfonate/bicarbonate transport system substrate-binding protein